MLKDFLKKNITSQAEFIQANGYGYGQVEPNHLSAQRTSQVYAQLPADKDIEVLEQGQFVKYDYANGVCNFTGPGEWMLVFNEIKLYRDKQVDAEFAMKKDDYQARIYSPFGGYKDEGAEGSPFSKQSRYYNGVDAAGNTSYTLGAVAPTYEKTTETSPETATGKTFYTLESDGTYKVVETVSDADVDSYYEMTDSGKEGVTYNFDDVTAGPDMYEIYYNEDPFHIESGYHTKKMPEGTTMVPRVFKTNVGDLMTTNTIGDASVAVGDILAPRAADGILSTSGDTTAMQWQVVKVYTMPDHQPGVKVMRIA